jgi:hypothetical protein
VFIPWIYFNLERRRISSTEIAQRSRKAEVDLIEARLASGETEHVIGSAGQEATQTIANQYLLARTARVTYLSVSGLTRALSSLCWCLLRIGCCLPLNELSPGLRLQAYNLQYGEKAWA